MNKLNSKNIVLVCPKFYGYEDYIADDLRKRGATVHLIFENVDWVKLSYRFVYVYMPSKKEKLLKRYYSKHLLEVLSDLDYFIVIRGSSLSPEIMEMAKATAPKTCKFIFYQWDGIANNKTALDIAPYFDRLSTFDINDAETYGWNYRPLFYIPENTDSTEDKNIDVLFICALHSNRAKVLNKLKVLCNERGYNLKAVVHLNRFLFYKYKYLNKKPEIVDADPKDLTFKPLTIKQSYELYSRSKIIVDYTNVHQTGYTMRTIESFGNRCKIATNNILIRKADFYKNENIFVYDEDEFDIPDEFIKSAYKLMPDELYQKYSLSSWIDDILGIKE